MDTPKFIAKMIDDVEAAQADIRSGDARLAAHGFKTMIALLTEHVGHLCDRYPEDRRMAEFLRRRMEEMETMRAKMQAAAEHERAAAERWSRLRAMCSAQEEEREAREKAQRAEQRRVNKLLAQQAAEQRRRDEVRRAEEEARQGKLFGDDSNLP